MTLDQYLTEYERLFKWRELWNRLSNSKRFNLAVQCERVEERAAIANRRIGELIERFDKEQSAPYETQIQDFIAHGDVYRQDIFDRLCTPGRSNQKSISSAIVTLERSGRIRRDTGPCSVHKGPLYRP